MPEYPSAAQTCADKIQAKIAVGIYPLGEWLPTIRQLCKQLDTGDGTVGAALALLVDKGVITHESRVGYYPGSKPPDHGPSRPRRNAVPPEPPAQPQISAAFLDNEFVTVAELSAYLRVSMMTANRHAKTMPGTIKVGSAIRIPSASVRAYLKKSGFVVDG
jgi:DNA-binding transcriptional MocR family regulator